MFEPLTWAQFLVLPGVPKMAHSSGVTQDAEHDWPTGASSRSVPLAWIRSARARNSARVCISLDRQPVEKRVAGEVGVSGVRWRF